MLALPPLCPTSDTITGMATGLTVTLKVHHRLGFPLSHHLHQRNFNVSDTKAAAARVRTYTVPIQPPAANHKSYEHSYYAGGHCTNRYRSTECCGSKRDAIYS